MADEATPTTIEEWRVKYPVMKNHATRKWGWRQWNGRWCPNYCTHLDATRAAYERDMEFDRLQRGATPVPAGTSTSGSTMSPRGGPLIETWVKSIA